MEWEVLRSSLDFALASQAPDVNLVFLGGEPLLEISKIARAAKYVDEQRPPDKRIKLFISTNGLLIDEAVAALLARHAFEVYLSFDGVEQAQQHRSAGSFSVLDRLLSNLRGWQPELFAQLRICMTLVPAAIPHLADSVRYLTGKEVQNISISPSLNCYPDWTEDRMGELDLQFSEICEDSMQRFRERGDIPLVYFRKRPDKFEPKPATRDMCGLARGTRLAVDVDGQVYGCAAMAESYQQFPSDLLRSRLAPLRMGDLRDPAFPERHAAFRENAEQMDLLKHKDRKYSSYGKCGQCEYVGRCSVCPISIGYDEGNTDPNRVSDFLCAFNRVAFKYCDQFSGMVDRLERIDALIRSVLENAPANESPSPEG